MELPERISSRNEKILLLCPKPIIATLKSIRPVVEGNRYAITTLPWRTVAWLFVEVCFFLVMLLSSSFALLAGELEQPVRLSADGKVIDTGEALGPRRDPCR